MIIRTWLAICLALLTQTVAGQGANKWGWAWSGDKSYAYAAITNDSGNVFGQYCYLESSTCLWLIGVPTACKEGDRHPVLINAASGALNGEIYCGKKVEKLFTSVFANFDDVDTIVRAGGRFGVALPLESDQFRVVRFTLDGSVPVIDAMRNAVTRAVKNGTKPTKDQLL